MNNAVKKIIILQSLLLIGCGSQNLVIETYIPKPLVKKYETITANLTFDEEINNFIFTPEQLQKREASLFCNCSGVKIKLFISSSKVKFAVIVSYFFTSGFGIYVSMTRF